MTDLWGPEQAQAFTQATTSLREALNGARTFDAVMSILDRVDLDALRILEEEFHFLPTPPQDLRSRIAHAHMRRLAEMKQYSTISVTARTVARWAEGVLEEWLPGYTDADERTGSQYRIKQMTDGTYQVETTQGYGARRFHVLVTVVEAT